MMNISRPSAHPRFGSLDDLYRLRLKRYETDLQEPAIKNEHGSVSLLQVLEAVVEDSRQSTYIKTDAFTQKTTDASDREQMSKALTRLKELGMLAYYYENHQQVQPTDMGKAAVRLIKASGKSNGVL